MSQIETNVIKPSTSFNMNGVEYITLGKELEAKLDGSLNKIVEFTKDNNGKGKSDEEKNELYLEAQTLWSEFKKNLDETKYNFNLNKDQWKFLSELILKKLEYDTNTVFVAIELHTLLANMGKAKFNDDETQAFSVNATEITYIYHLISTYKVRGLGKDAFIFADILRKIGDISKLVNYYDTAGKNIATDIQDWVVLFDDNVSLEQVAEEV